MSITLSLIAITSLISVIAWQRPALLHSLLYWPPGVRRGQWWRMLTHGLVHADGAHLAFNMITLFFFGSIMERVMVPYIGIVGFVLFYLAGILIAILPTHVQHRNDPNYRSLGASGAVSAVLFAFILLDPWAMLFVFFVPVPAVLFAVVYVAYSIWATKGARDNINHSAHLWGGAWGVVFMAILDPQSVGRFMYELFAPLGF